MLRENISYLCNTLKVAFITRVAFASQPEAEFHFNATESRFSQCIFLFFWHLPLKAIPPSYLQMK